MTKNDVAFDDWFDNLQSLLSDEGIDFRDADAVRDDYQRGKSVFDVCDEIKAEYAS